GMRSRRGVAETSADAQGDLRLPASEIKVPEDGGHRRRGAMDLGVFVETGPDLVEHLNRGAQSSLQRLGVAEHEIRLEYRIGMSRCPDSLHGLKGEPAAAGKVPARKAFMAAPQSHGSHRGTATVGPGRGPVRRIRAG